MKRRRMGALGLLLMMTCGIRASMAAGENLVANGTFDTDLSGWEAVPSSTTRIQWASDDADGAPGSGSAEIAVPERSSVQLQSACVPVVGGGDYVFGAAAKRAGTTEYFSRTAVLLSWWQGAACDNDSYLSREEILAGYPPAWRTTSRIVSAPVDAASANVRVIVSVGSIPLLAAGEFSNQHVAVTGNFDNIVFAPLQCTGTCGDAIPDTADHAGNDATAGLVTSSDALYILKGAIGEETCPQCICDVNGSGDVSATDALLTLAAATGAPVSLTCPQ